MRNALGPFWGGTEVGVVAAPMRGSSGDAFVVGGFVVELVVELAPLDDDGLEDVVAVESELEPQAERVRAPITNEAARI
ncbi:MAG TPA: hypothetical protein VF711_11110, partial [Acidimicrobiales bacterium]